MSWFRKKDNQQSSYRVSVRDADVAREHINSGIRKAAEQGDVEAQSHLGTCYRIGLGVDKDDAEAFKWFWKAAEQGHADAQCNLALIYLERMDITEALKWFGKAAKQGHAEAKEYLKQLGVR